MPAPPITPLIGPPKKPGEAPPLSTLRGLVTRPTGRASGSGAGAGVGAAALGNGPIRNGACGIVGQAEGRWNGLSSRSVNGTALQFLAGPMGPDFAGSVAPH